MIKSFAFIDQKKHFKLTVHFRILKQILIKDVDFN